MRIAALALGLSLAAGACASSGTAASDQSPTGATTRSRTAVITAEELRQSGAPTLADVVRQLRPGWATSVAIFVNETYYGGYDTLRNLSRNNAREVRFLTRSEAQMKWGPRYQEVIQVITK